MISQLIVLTFIAAFIGMSQVCMARDIMSGDMFQPRSDTNPPNLVMEPKYSQPEKKAKDDNNTDEPGLKLQYEPITDQGPVLEERQAQEERKGGSQYKSGNEVHIAPTSEHVLRNEQIQEKEMPQCHCMK